MGISRRKMKLWVLLVSCAVLSASHTIQDYKYKITSKQEYDEDWFGEKIDAAHGHLVVGAPNDRRGKGSVTVESGKKIPAPDGTLGQFGVAVATNGVVIAVGDSGIVPHAHVYLFTSRLIATINLEGWP